MKQSRLPKSVMVMMMTMRLPVQDFMTTTSLPVTAGYSSNAATLEFSIFN
jgi:hypothetical protein